MWEERLSEFVTLFLVVNPIGVLPVFLALTGVHDQSMRRRIALQAVIVAFVVLTFFLFAGGFLLQKLGISIRAFQIAGGIVLFVVALEMVRGDEHATGGDPAAQATALAIYPLAIPKIAGPAAMLAIVLLADDDRYDLLGRSATALVLALVMGVQLVLLLAAAPISRVIGPAGAGVIGRVMGILLAAMAVNMVLAALVVWLGLPSL